MQEKSLNWRLIGTVLSVNLLSFATGNSYAFTSPVLPKLHGNEDNPLGKPITLFGESMIGSLINLGASIGVIVFGILLDKIGRKNTLFLLAIPVTIANIILTFAQTVELYCLARFILGFGTGCTFSVIRTYIGEITEDKNRGAFGCFLNIMANISTLISYSIGSFISIKMFCIYNIAPCLIFFVVWVFWIPETPYYLILSERCNDAQIVLQNLRTGCIQKELEEIRKTVKETTANQIKFYDIFKSRAISKALLIAFAFMLFQQLSGITAVVCYMQSIFAAAGTELSSEISTIIVASVMLFMTFVTSLLIDRLGRKILLVASLSLLCLSLTSLGGYFFLKTNNYDVSSLGAVPVTSLIVYFVGFNIGIGPVTWAMFGELFPMEVKSLATTTTVSFCHFAGFILSIFYPNFSAAIGVAQCFWLFAICCAVGALFVIFVVPKTKGKSLNEIQLLLGDNKSKC